MSAAKIPLRLDPRACDGCGRCSSSCRRNALRVGTGYILVDWSRCDGCGKCADLCDREAIVLRDAPAAPVAPSAAPASTSPVAGRSLWPGKRAHAGEAASEEGGPSVGAWTLPEAVLVLVVSFALLIGVQALFGQASAKPGVAGLLLVTYDSGLLALLGFYSLRRAVSPWRLYRLDALPETGSMFLALGLFVVLRVFAVVYTIASGAAGFAPPTGEGADLTTLFGGGGLGALTTVLVVAVAGPLLEEVALRGVLLGALRGRIGPVPAVIVTALVFSVLHVSAWSFVPLTALGLALGWLAVRSRSLWPAIVLHIAYNALILVSAFRAAGG